MRSLRILVLFLSALAVVPAFAANSATPSGNAQFNDRQDRDEQRDRTIEEMNRKRQKALNEENYQKLKRDAERLLELATELKQYVDKSGEHVMSIEVIRKSEEMEKLAKDLHNRMKGQ